MKDPKEKPVRKKRRRKVRRARPLSVARATARFTSAQEKLDEARVDLMRALKAR